MQNPFASEDAMVVIKLRHAVTLRPDGWNMCPLLQPCVDDGNWFRLWGQHLDVAQVVVIGYSDKYRENCATRNEKDTDLMKEAKKISERMEQNKSSQR